MKHYTIIRSDNFSETEYDSTSRNVLKAADEYGRTNDQISIYDGDKLVSRAVWDVTKGKYVRVSI